MLKHALDKAIFLQLSKRLRYASYKMFDRHLLLTNSVISIVMGVFGDSVTQNHSIKYGHRQCKSALLEKLEQSGKVQVAHNKLHEQACDKINLKLNEFDEAASKSGSKCPVCDETFQDSYNYVRGCHMAAAGWSTGIGSHIWYKYLDRWLGTSRTFKIVTLKVLLDQIIMSPVNLVLYFGTVALLERSSLGKFKEEVLEKGMRNIFLVECVVWPPAQYFSFAFLPYKYRILWDNIVSFGFDIYNPHVKYDIRLESELEEKQAQRKLREDKY